MVYNQVSSKAVIAKVFRDLDLQEENHREVDFTEWIGEGMEKIGSFYAYNIKVTGKDDIPLITVTDYQAKLPFDLVNILGVQYSDSQTGTFTPLRYGTSTYGTRSESTAVSLVNSIAATSDVVTMAMELYDYTYEEALEFINTDPVMASKLSTYLIGTNSITYPNSNSDDLLTDQYVYYVNNGYIKLNIRSGYLKVAYQAISVDEEGYPMIPNDPSFFEALYWYITMKLLYPQWARGSVRDAVYQDARLNWNYYCNQAFGKSMMPNVDKLESLKNKWLQLYPEINDHATLFSNSGNSQIIYNH